MAAFLPASAAWLRRKPKADSNEKEGKEKEDKEKREDKSDVHPSLPTWLKPKRGGVPGLAMTFGPSQPLSALVSSPPPPRRSPSPTAASVRVVED
mmetsp:Transcript_36058/g.93791  ORF Transcript_36058/g.93791 Transcript_36058/m.93791 type:complete len:95 (-) Transcript_36058:23-307(-)